MHYLPEYLGLMAVLSILVVPGEIFNRIAGAAHVFFGIRLALARATG
jgi:hypothetical protein